MNADSGFDSKELRAVCAKEEIQANIKSNPRNNNNKENGLDEQYFDEELYKKRTVIEQANAWMDSYKALLIRYETLARNWMAFSAFFLNRINKKSKV